MSFIINVPMVSVMNGTHKHSENCILISITDIAHIDVEPVLSFKSVYRFKFMDVMKDSPTVHEGITDQQATQIVAILKEALENGQDVVVHCHAGLCRSGAVAEVGVMMGFSDMHVVRQPNSFVKWRLMKVLGWTYD